MKTALLPAMLLFSALLAAGDLLQVGSPLPALTLKDQHDVRQSVAPDTRYLVFAAERAPSALVETAFEGQTAQSPAAVKASYVADISGMPGLIAATFALPKMRKRPYPMLLARTPAESAMLPRESGKVTLIELRDGKVASIRFLASAGGIRSALGLGR
jgi:hypothetical protein